MSRNVESGAHDTRDTVIQAGNGACTKRATGSDIENIRFDEVLGLLVKAKHLLNFASQISIVTASFVEERGASAAWRPGLALIYADRAQPGSIAAGEKELSLLRTLRNQAVMAFRQAG